MIAALVACLAFGAQEPEAPSAAALISKMLAHYSGLKSLTGTIRLTTRVASSEQVLVTTVQFKKPSLVFIRQAYDSGEGRSWLVVSDGRRFSYPVPPNLPLTAEERLVEAVTQNGVVNTCQDIYAASSASLKDRSAPLDIAFGRLTDLRFLRNQWVTLRWLGQQSYRDRTVDAIGGDWREYGRAPASGTYRMLISKDSDLVLYELAGREAVGDPARGILVPLLVTSTWEVDLHPNAETDDSLFKL